MFKAMEFYAIYPYASVAFTAAHRQSYSRRLLGIRIEAKKLISLLLQHWAGVSLNTSSLRISRDL